MNKILLIGNDINNINNSKSWKSLLKRIVSICGNKIDISDEKPFPLLYEEIYLKALKSNNINEEDLKFRISEIVNEIEPNEIHDDLLKMDIKDYVTTNYDYVLEKVLLGNQSTKDLKNEGHISETKYSVFRHNTLNGKRFWHIHGEVNVPRSITLGFEHYGGQLQQFRNYAVTGTNYKSKNDISYPLHKRLKEDLVNNDSWIDFFFKDEIHIIGLKLGYVETDLWWLITNRARFQLEKSNICKSRIIYYCPKIYEDKNKAAIMDANEIEVKYINLEGIRFYKEVIKMVNNGI